MNQTENSYCNSHCQTGGRLEGSKIEFQKRGQTAASRANKTRNG